MRQWTWRRLPILIVALVILGAPSSASAAFYPESGSLYYNGAYYADPYLKWFANGPWQTSDPTYEHDFAMRPSYLSDCTTWTNLPNAYDDCPTAGVSESGALWVFSFGSYHAKNIQPWTQYFGSWNFSGGEAYMVTTEFDLSGQEGHRYFCSWDSIWCINGVRSENIFSGYLNWGQSYYRSW